MANKQYMRLLKQLCWYSGLLLVISLPNASADTILWYNGD